MKRVMWPTSLIFAATTILLAFQNCGGGISDTSVAASCVSRSVFKVAYPSGTSFSVPFGNTTAPLSCVNASGFNTLTFNPNNQTITLSGSSPNMVFQLTSGGGGCSGQNNLGGDNWMQEGNASNTLETEIGPTSVQITYASGPISCNVVR